MPGGQIKPGGKPGTHKYRFYTHHGIILESSRDVTHRVMIPDLLSTLVPLSQAQWVVTPCSVPAQTLLRPWPDPGQTLAGETCQLLAQQEVIHPSRDHTPFRIRDG